MRPTYKNNDGSGTNEDEKSKTSDETDESKR